MYVWEESCHLLQDGAAAAAAGSEGGSEGESESESEGEGEGVGAGVGVDAGVDGVGGYACVGGDTCGVGGGGAAGGVQGTSPQYPQGRTGHSAYFSFLPLVS